jgi:hypothetical protein
MRTVTISLEVEVPDEMDDLLVIECLESAMNHSLDAFSHVERFPGDTDSNVVRIAKHLGSMDIGEFSIA